MDKTILKEYEPFLANLLSPYRLRHSVGVMRVMRELANIYELDVEKAMVAALLHDAAKELPPDLQVKIIVEAPIKIYTPCEQNFGVYLHAPVGSYLVNRDLAISDLLVLDAISMHTYYGVGGNLKSIFTWCLRFSDYLEPNRNWEVVNGFKYVEKRLRKSVFEGKFEEASFLLTAGIMRIYTDRGISIHPNMRTVYDELKTEFYTDHNIFIE